MSASSGKTKGNIRVRELDSEYTEPASMNLNQRLKHERDQLEQKPELKAKAVYETIKKYLDKDKSRNAPNFKPAYLGEFN